MKRYLLILFCGLLCYPAAHAVIPPAVVRSLRTGSKVVMEPTAWSSSRRALSGQLERRYLSTLKQAYDAQNTHLPNLVMQDYGAAVRTDRKLNLSAAELYPQQTFLTTQKQLTKYFLANNNKLIKQMFEQSAQFQRVLVEHLPQFRADKQIISHPPQQDIPWLAAQIPANTQYLLLGEYHDEKNFIIQKNIEQVLRAVRERFPQRDVFVLTEFLLNGEEISALNPQKNPYLTVFKTARELDMLPVGLEPWFVQSKPPINLYYTQYKNTEYLSEKKLWSSPEGVRLRNIHWLELIGRYRAKYPNALFIIYAGAGHLEYNYFHSIGAALPPAQTFFIAFFPNTNGSYFEKLVNNPFPHDRILQFRDPQLRRLAGFDIRIAVPQ